MSNIIKSYTIRYDSMDKMTIDYKDRDDELQAKRLGMIPLPEHEEGFTEGLQALTVDPVILEEEQRKKARVILEKANKEAADILEAAKEEAKSLIVNARKEGYEEGINNGVDEIRQLKNNLLEQKQLQEKEYKEMISETSEQVTDIMISLITKLTGIFVEDKSDVILYLVEKALLDEDRVDNYTIRVSRGDVDILSSKKEYIESITRNDIQIVVDMQLTKNQCLIETENKVINCSLDVQLDNLITDLKMLSNV